MDNAVIYNNIDISDTKGVFVSYDFAEKRYDLAFIQF